ncbi:MAG: helix-turn-helix domain-containing protein [Desulfobacterales bacterium]
MAAPYFAEPFGNLNHCAVETAYRTATDGRMKERLLMVLLSMEGRHAPEIAAAVHRTPETVLRWLHRWNKSGFGGLDDRPYSGRPPVLTPEEQAVTVKWVNEQAESGRRLTCRQISVHIFENFGKKPDHDTVCRMLHRHGSSWKKPGKQDHRGDPALQCEFKKNLKKREKKNRQPVFFTKMK